MPWTCRKCGHGEAGMMGCSNPDCMQEQIDHLTRINSELVEACKEFVQWFDYISAYQHGNLVNGQTLETAAKNWETMVTPSPDITKMRTALANATSKEGK